MKEHISVMTDELLDVVKPWESVEIFVDATLGLAGHSSLILSKCPISCVIGFDQDPFAREIARERLSGFEGRFEIEADNFRHIGRLSYRDGWTGADAVFFDLGISNLQITEPERGFSFQDDGPLDMRMDSDEECNSTLTAGEILREWSIKDLTQIFRDYGEDPHAYQIAKGIVRFRENGGTIETTSELVELIRKILPAPVQRKMGGHPARKIFQALRIAVNDEMNALNEALDGAIKIVRPGGRIIAISYHSLEDRMVKHRFRKWKDDGLGDMNPRKALLPSAEEVDRNYKSRSAKLRVFVYSGLTGGKLNALQRIPT